MTEKELSTLSLFIKLCEQFNIEPTEYNVEQMYDAVELIARIGDWDND